MASKLLLAFLLTVLLITYNPSDSNAILYEGIRPLGMGNAFTAVADDENAIFYNPAGLSYITSLKIGVLNPKIGVARDSIDLLRDASDTDFDETREVADLLRQYTGKPQHINIGLFPHVGHNIRETGILFGVLANTSVDIEIRNPTWPENYVNLNSDIGPVIGAGYEIDAVDGLRAGLAFKYIFRKSLNEMYTPAQIASEDFEDIIEDDLGSGSALSMDIGAIYELPDPIPFVDKTTVGIAGLNLPNRSMGSATSINYQFNTGIAVEKALYPWCTAIGAFDIHDITTSAIDKGGLSRRVHMGAEFQFPYLSVRTGINDGYLSAGGTLDLRAFKLDLATYAIEKGVYSGQKSDRRYLIQLFFGW